MRRRRHDHGSRTSLRRSHRRRTGRFGAAGRILESAFQTAFPDIAGYRSFLVSVTTPTPERIGAVVALEGGSDLRRARDRRRLDAFHRVENTQFSTFRRGSPGCRAADLSPSCCAMLERRRELALRRGRVHLAATARSSVWNTRRWAVSGLRLAWLRGGVVTPM
jgi:hypothetical protein